MAVEAKTIELTGKIDKNHHLIVNQELPLEPGRVKIVIFPSEASGETDDDPSMEAIYKTAQAGKVFDFLADPEEDIYSVDDGKPIEW